MELPCSAALVPVLCNAHLPGNAHCTTWAVRLLNMPNQLDVFSTPWTHCTGDEEVMSMRTGKLLKCSRSGMQDASGTIFKPGRVGRSANFISHEHK